MTARIWKSALALGAVLAVSGAARAADSDTQHLTGGGKAGSTTTTMTLGGKGTVAQNATGNAELTRGFYHHGGWGGYHGYHGWGGGWGHHGYYGGWGGYGYRGFGYGGWGGYYGGYRPYYYGSFYRPYYGYSYYRPYYSSYYSYPYYSSYYGGYGGYGGWGGYGGYGCGTGFYIGISGGAGTNAPAVNLGSLSTPKAEGSTSQPIFGKVSTDTAPAKTEYKYKAYGEK